jgi:hypothetical protein
LVLVQVDDGRFRKDVLKGVNVKLGEYRVLCVEDNVGNVDGGLSLAGALKFLAKLEKAVLYLIFNEGVKFLLPADQLRLCRRLTRRWCLNTNRRSLMLINRRASIGL